MVDPVLSEAGKKGAAIRRAKKQAAETGQVVALPQYGVAVQVDGEILSLEGPLLSQITEDAEIAGALVAGPAASEEPLVEGEPRTATEVNRDMGRPDDWRPGSPGTASDYQPLPGYKGGDQTIEASFVEGKGYIIGERDAGGVYQHIARAASRDVVKDFMTLMDMKVPQDQAFMHLNKKHGAGAITADLSEPVKYDVKYVEEEPGLTRLTQAGQVVLDPPTPPAPPKMSPLTGTGVVVDQLVEGEIDPPTRDEEAFHDKGDRMAALAEEVAEGTTRREEDLKRDEGDAYDGGPPVPDFADTLLPNTLLGRANWYVSNHGLSEEDALALAQVQLGVVSTPTAPPGAPATPGSGEHLGPDAALVAAYQERMKNYVEPKLDVMITIENPNGDDWAFPMPVRFLDYLLRSAQYETIKRRREVTPADRLQMILREFRRDDQEVRLLMAPGAHSGPAGTFNPAAGRWE